MTYTIELRYESGRKEYVPIKASSDKAARSEAAKWVSEHAIPSGCMLSLIYRKDDGARGVFEL